MKKISVVLALFLSAAALNAAPYWRVKSSTTGATTAELSGDFLVYDSTSSVVPSASISRGTMTAEYGDFLNINADINNLYISTSAIDQSIANERAARIVNDQLLGAATGYLDETKLDKSSAAVTYLYKTEKAADSELLDGQDGSYYAVKSEVITATTSLRSDLTSEINRAIARENEIAVSTGVLRSDLTAETAARIAADNLIGGTTAALRADLTAETTTRIYVDNLLGAATAANYADIQTRMKKTADSQLLMGNYAVLSSSSISANEFFGDGSKLTGINVAGDNLGNHTATTTLNLDGNNIANVNISSIQFIYSRYYSEYDAGGKARFDTVPDLPMRIHTPLSLENYAIHSASSISAGIYYGDGSALSNLPTKDNLGNHVATTTLNMSNFPIINVSTLTAFRVNATTIVPTEIYSIPRNNYAALSSVFTGSSTIVGWSALTAGRVWINVMKLGKVVYVDFRIEGTGSGATTSFTLPYLSYNTGYGGQSGTLGFTFDNATLTTPGRWFFANNTYLVRVYKDTGTTEFVNAGTKIVAGSFWYFTSE